MLHLSAKVAGNGTPVTRSPSMPLNLDPMAGNTDIDDRTGHFDARFRGGNDAPVRARVQSVSPFSSHQFGFCVSSFQFMSACVRYLETMVVFISYTNFFLDNQALNAIIRGRGVL